MSLSIPEFVGPILFARGGDGEQYRISALVVTAADRDPPQLRPMGQDPVAPVALLTRHERTAWRFDFALPAESGTFYRIDNEEHAVFADMSGDVRIAYVSCNGQEHRDEDRPLAERNGMWRRLTEEHDRAGFCLLLHGGDQLYADEVVQTHPTLSAWAEAGMEAKPSHPFTAEMREAAERYFFRRYCELYTEPGVARLLARVPSIMMWDDHDIIDGWGSHPAAMLDSPVGRGLFEVARAMFLLFQTASEPDGAGGSLTTHHRFPGFDVISPDLRSERRPDRVMAEQGWDRLAEALDTPGIPRRLLMSSVPLLGPRLSWVEALIGIVPKLRRYEDDLRDQWQSHAHRAEWRRILTMIDHTTADGKGSVTVLSGEIHLATRAEMALQGGAVLNQLVASGIAHPEPPAAYARGLGGLAAFGEDPLPGQPIRIRPLPGHRSTYVAERNYLVLERRSDRWSASWELEKSGRTPAMDI